MMSSDMFLTPSNPSSALLSVFWNISTAEETPKLKRLYLRNPMCVDIIVFGRNQEEHNKQLCKLFELLKKRNLTLNKAKCEFNKDKLEFYGHIFSAVYRYLIKLGMLLNILFLLYLFFLFMYKFVYILNMQSA
jgi:hypothetical protein